MNKLIPYEELLRSVTDSLNKAQAIDRGEICATCKKWRKIEWDKDGKLGGMCGRNRTAFDFRCEQWELRL